MTDSRVTDGPAGGGQVHDAAFDLVVLGGHVIDPASGLDEVLDIGVRYGRIAAIAKDLSHGIAGARLEHPQTSGTTVLDAAGCFVLPGLVDLHTHVYVGVCPLTVSADDVASRTGVTTMISAGDAGASTIGGFRHLAAERSLTRVAAFLNVSTIGLSGWPVGECRDLDLLDVPAAVRAGRENSDIVVGVKVRMTAPIIVGNLGLEPLRRAVAVADALGKPVMMHIGSAPQPLPQLLSLLRRGDIVTHAYSGMPNGISAAGVLLAEVQEARARGILFDVGHGYSSFDMPVATLAADAGLWPDTISSDLHSLSVEGPAYDLPTTISKFLSFGMPLQAVVAAVTSAPAEAIGREDSIGSLRIGGDADIAIIRLEQGEFPFRDSSGNHWTGRTAMRVIHTVRSGLVWGGPRRHPGRASPAMV